MGTLSRTLSEPTLKSSAEKFHQVFCSNPLVLHQPPVLSNALLITATSLQLGKVNWSTGNNGPTSSSSHHLNQQQQPSSHPVFML